MAIYHMQAKVVSRGSGRSAVAASAYMSCSRMYNDYDGIQHDYTRKHGLIYQEVMLPPMAPSEWNDREQLWNAVEETEKTKDSRLAREFVVALPVELNKDTQIMVRLISTWHRIIMKQLSATQTLRQQMRWYHSVPLRKVSKKAVTNTKSDMLFQER